MTIEADSKFWVYPQGSDLFPTVWNSSLTCFSRKIVSLFHHDLTLTLQISLTENLKPLLPSILSHSYTHSMRFIFHSSQQPFLQNSPGFMAQTLPSRHYISLPHNCLTPPIPKYFYFVLKTIPVITMQIVTVGISWVLLSLFVTSDHLSLCDSKVLTLQTSLFNDEDNAVMLLSDHSFMESIDLQVTVVTSVINSSNWSDKL